MSDEALQYAVAVIAWLALTIAIPFRPWSLRWLAATLFIGWFVLTSAPAFHVD